MGVLGYKVGDPLKCMSGLKIQNQVTGEREKSEAGRRVWDKWMERSGTKTRSGSEGWILWCGHGHPEGKGQTSASKRVA